MKILVTGGSGFIGRCLTEQLAGEGHELVNLDLCAPDWSAPFSRVVLGDVRDEQAVNDAIRGCQAVFHLAAAHHDTGIDVATYFDVNERGTATLLAAMDAHGIEQLCFVSTVAVYGDSDRVPNEHSEPRPLSPYGASKLAAERLISGWIANKSSRSALIVRPSVVFGPHNFANMYSLIRQIHSGRYLQVGAGSNFKSMCYVENLVAFMLHARGTSGLRMFNYVDQPDMTSKQIAACIAAALGRTGEVISLPLPLVLAAMWPIDLLAQLLGKQWPVSGFRIRKFACHETRFDASAARTIGFVPPVALADGIRRMVDWYLREGRRVAPVWRIPPSTWVGSQTSSQVVTPS